MVAALIQSRLQRVDGLAAYVWRRHGLDHLVIRTPRDQDPVPALLLGLRSGEVESEVEFDDMDIL